MTTLVRPIWPDATGAIHTEVYLFEHDDLALRAHELVLLPVEVALGRVEQLLELPVAARDAGDREPRALPQLVVVDLGHRNAEAVLELRLRRLHVLPLPLQRARLREVELDGEDADVAPGHARMLTERPGYDSREGAAATAAGTAGIARSVRST